MPKFCRKCGAEMDDAAKFCRKCGTAFDISAAYHKAVDQKKIAKIKKTIKLIVAAIIVIFVAILTINIVNENTGYNAVIKKAMKAVESSDIDSLVAMSSDMFFYKNNPDIEKKYKSTVTDCFKTFNSGVGDDYKLSYTVEKTFSPAAGEYNQWIETVKHDYPDFDVSKIDKAVYSYITVSAKESKRSVSTKIKIIMTKENGKWKLADLKRR